MGLPHGMAWTVGHHSNPGQGVAVVKCSRCGRDISQGESYAYFGETL